MAGVKIAKPTGPVSNGPSKGQGAEKKTYHHGNLRDAMISHGRRILELEGIGAMSLRLAARHAGVSQTAPGYHFGNKEGLLAAIAAQGFKELADQRLSRLAETTDPEQRVVAIVGTYLDFALKNKGLFHLMFGPKLLNRVDHAELLSEALKSFALFDVTVSTFARLCGWPEESVPEATIAAWSVEHGLTSLILNAQFPLSPSPTSVERAVDTTIKVLIEGIRLAASTMVLRTRACCKKVETIFRLKHALII